MGFGVGTSVPVITVFVQGLLSFFSPCVLPLVPLYLGYLAGGSARTREDGTIDYPRRTVLVNTVFFVVGVSFAFFLLGFGFTALGQFFTGNQRAFSVVAGLIMVAFGLYMLGVFGRVRAVETERRLPFRLDRFAMNPLVALVLGFTFSFAWTPCIGPVLAGVLLMASSSASAAMGYALVGVYTLGFVLPFLAVGLFTGAVLRFFRTHGNVVKYTVEGGRRAARRHGRHDHHRVDERRDQLPVVVRRHERGHRAETGCRRGWRRRRRRRGPGRRRACRFRQRRRQRRRYGRKRLGQGRFGWRYGQRPQAGAPGGREAG